MHQYKEINVYSHWPYVYHIDDNVGAIFKSLFGKTVLFFFSNQADHRNLQMEDGQIHLQPTFIATQPMVAIPISSYNVNS